MQLFLGYQLDLNKINQSTASMVLKGSIIKVSLSNRFCRPLSGFHLLQANYLMDVISSSGNQHVGVLTFHRVLL